VASLAHNVAPGDSLYKIARQYNVDIRDLQVVRGDKTFDLGAPDHGFEPTSLSPEDTVLVPDASQPNASGLQSCGADAENLAASTNAPTQALTPQGKALEEDCAAADGDLSTKAPCVKPRFVIVIDPGHGGTSYKDNAKDDSSSWNNAVGVVSDVLEKTMSQRLAGILEQTLKGWAGVFAAYVDIEVLLTKTDENVNLRGRDRAKVAKDAKADFFVILHFNSVNKKMPRKQEQPGFMDITPGVDQKRDQPAGYTRGLFSTAEAQRGPQRVKRKTNIAADHTLITSDAFSKSVVNNVVAAMKTLDATPYIQAHGDYAKDVAVLSKSFLGKKGIACCYLEGDFINVESGDRAWNPVQYAANIPSINGGTPVDASALPGENAMFEAASVAIAVAIFAPILRTSVVPQAKEDLNDLLKKLDPSTWIKPLLGPQQ